MYVKSKKRFSKTCKQKSVFKKMSKEIEEAKTGQPSEGKEKEDPQNKDEDLEGEEKNEINWMGDSQFEEIDSLRKALIDNGLSKENFGRVIGSMRKKYIEKAKKKIDNINGFYKDLKGDEFKKAFKLLSDPNKLNSESIKLSNKFIHYINNDRQDEKKKKREAEILDIVSKLGGIPANTSLNRLSGEKRDSTMVNWYNKKYGENKRTKREPEDFDSGILKQASDFDESMRLLSQKPREN